MRDPLNEEEIYELLTQLGLADQDTMLLDLDRTEVTEDSATMTMVLVDGRRIIVTRHGFGETGARAEITAYVDTDDPRPAVMEVLTDDGFVSTQSISVMNQGQEAD